NQSAPAFQPNRPQARARFIPSSVADARVSARDTYRNRAAGPTRVAARKPRAPPQEPTNMRQFAVARRLLKGWGNRRFRPAEVLDDDWHGEFALGGGECVGGGDVRGRLFVCGGGVQQLARCERC